MAPSIAAPFSVSLEICMASGLMTGFAGMSSLYPPKPNATSTTVGPRMAAAKRNLRREPSAVAVTDPELAMPVLTEVEAMPELPEPVAAAAMFDDEAADSRPDDPDPRLIRLRSARISAADWQRRSVSFSRDLRITSLSAGG